MKQHAFPKSRPSPWSRLAALALSGGFAFYAVQCFRAGEYGFSLFGLLFVVMAAVALRLSVRGLA